MDNYRAITNDAAAHWPGAHWPDGALRFRGRRDPYLAVKRCFDVFIALMALLMLAPLMLTITLMIRRDGGPALFGHRRIGFEGRNFTCLKFRSMVLHADEVLERHLVERPEAREEWEATQKLRDDPRVTSVGRFLRSTSFDELPQLFNVLTGDMSIVGPRPIVEDEVSRYGDLFIYYTQCVPGITGLWQVSGRSDLSYESRVTLDEAYYHDRCLLNDVSILWRTPRAVVSRRGAH